MIIFVKKQEMRVSDYKEDCTALLDRKGVLTVEDFMALWPGVPAPTVYSRIRSLQRDGTLSQAGRGEYLPAHKVRFQHIVSEKMRAVRECLLEECIGTDYCLCERSGNLFVEVAKSEIPRVETTLKKHFPKVVLQKEAEAFPSVLEGYVIVDRLVTDAPLTEIDSIPLPSLEKSLVDRLFRKRMNGKERRLELQKTMETYPVNVSRMRRYASRRGVREELSSCLSELDTSRLEMFSSLQNYLSSIPVIRAWVFGSFARGEETAESDLDLLVDYDKSVKISLFDIVGYKLEMEKIAGREVDLVENGFLKSFAVPSAEKDKYLIYEKQS